LHAHLSDLPSKSRTVPGGASVLDLRLMRAIIRD
jgi:hypothetical protein